MTRNERKYRTPWQLHLIAAKRNLGVAGLIKNMESVIGVDHIFDCVETSVRYHEEMRVKSAPIPENEARRLERLDLYRILDTPPEDAFDRITRIVAETIGVPIALVSLIDRDRQWFKSKYGLDAPETPRQIAFCAHAILGDETFVVEDASKDTRFSDNPLVVSDPSIRFYAGAPLKTSEGLNLGTLCAIDRRPRQLSASHRQLLEDLAHLVVDEMELRLALRKAMNEAAEEIRLRTMHDEFVATVSHELRTPLTSIRGSLGLLESGVAGDLPERARNMVTIANRNATKLLTLINDLLDIKKMDAGRLEFDFTTVAVKEFLAETCEGLQGFAVDNDVSLELVCNGLPNIVADPARLRQALVNLISNAVKVSPPQGTVTIKAETREDSVCFEVTDRGPGIPEAFQSRLFERFAQADGPTKAKGTGLGLAISKAIVEAHNGSVGFITAPDQGTTFHITIPKRQTLAR